MWYRILRSLTKNVHNEINKKYNFKILKEEHDANGQIIVYNDLFAEVIGRSGFKISNGVEECLNF